MPASFTTIAKTGAALALAALTLSACDSGGGRRAQFGARGRIVDGLSLCQAGGGKLCPVEPPISVRR